MRLGLEGGFYQILYNGLDFGAGSTKKLMLFVYLFNMKIVQVHTR